MFKTATFKEIRMGKHIRQPNQIPLSGFFLRNGVSNGLRKLKKNFHIVILFQRMNGAKR
jgi:hypothetical protein